MSKTNPASTESDPGTAPGAPPETSPPADRATPAPGSAPETPTAGGASEPGPAPGETPASETPPEVDWSQFSAEESVAADEEEPTPPPSEEPAAAEEEPQPLEGSGEEPRKETPEEPKTPSSEEPETPTPEEPQRQTEEERQAAWDQMRTEAFNALKGQYKFDDELATRFAETPEEVLPELAAQLHMNIYDSVFSALRAAVPQIVNQMQQQTGARQQFERAFYDKWPKLKEFPTDVNRFLRTYVSMNPEAQMDQIINDVGAQVMVARRIPFTDAAPARGAGPATEVVEPAEPPFQPASPAGGGGEAPAGRSSPWEEIIAVEE